MCRHTEEYFSLLFEIQLQKTLIGINSIHGTALIFKTGLSVTPAISYFQNSGDKHREQMPGAEFWLKHNYGWFVNCMPN